jgi:hypothetical protein
MQQYDKAKEILEPLSILGEDTTALGHFFDFAQIMSSSTIEPEEKTEKIKTILEKQPTMYRQIVSALLTLDVESAWQVIDPIRTKELLDILWFLNHSQLDLARINASETLQTLYYAKGYLQTPMTHSDIFSLTMLATAKKGGLEGGDLLFSYLCQKCKQSFPVSFTRCPNCSTINSVRVEEKIVKSSPLSLQTRYSIV